MSEKYNTVMDESDENAVCIMVDKPISKEGYAENFLPRVDSMIAQKGFFSVLVYYKDFKGWEKEATKMDLGSALQYGDKLRKAAIVNPPEKEVFARKIVQPLLKGEVKFFEESDLDNALQWVKS